MAEAQIAVGIPEDIRAVVEHAADREGLHLSEWIRRALLREASERPTTLNWHWRNILLHHYPSASVSEDIAGLLRTYSDEIYPSNSFPGSGLSNFETKTFGIYGLALFSSRIDQGAILLSAALIEGSMGHFRPLHARTRINRPRSWLDSLVVSCRDRATEVRQALQFEWEPTGRAAELALDAFKTLSELTQTSWELQRLCQTDRPRAFHELARHLELATQQFELNARLVAEVEAIDAPSPVSDRLNDVQTNLLNRAGGGLSLTAAADRLGISRQALHKRAKTGSALALMQGDELVLPLAQWVSTGTSLTWIDGLPKVIKLFKTAGGWSALQFLIEQDPNLGTTPRLALIDGRVDDVVSAAEAYLGIEGEA
ncbi:hypothetical protein BS627_03675 [Agrobacterium salinitolerans]|uniref:hypothetical protein n=1 Tax=Agrobacterium salinitolerans TaxID=1183413 RepID=UPI0009D1855A|nr:hypothetical protein [Agrobacterium salinitolerans]OOO27819.1 hypothetical protein BS627_03675 [Agrobacterium salinitolerans]